ncbi:MAG: hypothetical protein O9302_02705 [Cyclobacteriaceae bacterium]|nr:hypothetical protein [Cytophagales bacterium]MCZ8326945.1 hypothetical protein [Cyclobacteriaceae bacterium]
MKTKIIKLSLIIIWLLLISCFVEYGTPEFPAGIVEGYKPVYLTGAEAEIKWKSPQPLDKPGKIYVFQNYLLVNERLKGVHVHNNTNPGEPISIGFLQVAGCTDMAIQGDVLYVNHIADLVALKINNFQSFAELSRIQQKDWINQFPEETDVYFECVDPSKGTVVGWELVTLHNPTCYR